MNAAMPLDTPSRARFSVDQFLAIGVSGALAGVGRTELIEGDIVKMNPQYRPHSRATFRLARAIEDALLALELPLGVVIEATVGMPPHNAPEPDIIVTSEPDGEGIVPLATVALLVEVADATIGFDLRQKAALYARHGIPEYWVVDLNAARIVRMWQPGAEAYAKHDDVPFGTAIEAATISGLVVVTDRLG